MELVQNIEKTFEFKNIMRNVCKTCRNNKIKINRAAKNIAINKNI